MIKIGTKLYFKPGYRWGEDWEESKIVGETVKSWLMPDGTKVNKVTMLSAGDAYHSKTRWFTKTDKEEHEFCQKWARDIGSAVSVCDNAGKLRAIAEIIGKELKS